MTDSEHEQESEVYDLSRSHVWLEATFVPKIHAGLEPYPIGGTYADIYRYGEIAVKILRCVSTDRIYIDKVILVSNPIGS